MTAAAPFLIWGIVLHLIADWPMQNEWMAQNKAKRRLRFKKQRNSIGIDTIEGSWWDRHPAAYVHAGIHGAIQLLIFPWRAALFIGITHLIIDTRTPVEWWSKLIRQTQPNPTGKLDIHQEAHPESAHSVGQLVASVTVPAIDIGVLVRVWTDQVFHIAIVAVAALMVTA